MRKKKFEIKCLKCGNTRMEFELRHDFRYHGGRTCHSFRIICNKCGSRLDVDADEVWIARGA